MDNAVALAAIALAASSVTGLIWLAKFVAKTLGQDLREHTKAALKQAQASREQIKTNKEMLSFMQKLNGQLPKITGQAMQRKRDEDRNR